MLTARHAGGISFCAPIGHIQIDGDYRESWQPHPMSEKALARAQTIAKKIVNELCGKKGRGIFGVELFVKGDKVWFSEVSPRPHDTGMVTMVSQTMNEMELHVRAILGLPIPQLRPNSAKASSGKQGFGGQAEIPCRPGASVAILANTKANNPVYTGIDKALKTPGTWIRLFGKSSSPGHRRMGVALTVGKNVAEARKRAADAAKAVKVVAG